MIRLPLLTATVSVFAFASACTNDGVGSSQQPLEPSCIENIEDLTPEDWLCPDDLTVECEDGGANPETIYLQPAGDLAETSCDDIELSINDEGPFGPGEHEIVITAEASVDGGEPALLMCEATLTVVDTVPPVAELTEPIELWPPNHKFHTVTPDQCANINDACDEDVDVVFLTASSNEPVNDTGDGNFEPDIVFDCDGVKLRSERRGPGDGRVYTLTWLATDDAGNETEGECKAIVPHDQSGREVIEGEPAYTVMAPDLPCPDDGDDHASDCQCDTCGCEACECDDEMMCGCEACECEACDCHEGTNGDGDDR